MKTIAKKTVGEFEIAIREGKSWDGKTVWLVDKSHTVTLKQHRAKRFFNKELAARYGRELVREMGA